MEEFKIVLTHRTRFIETFMNKYYIEDDDLSFTNLFLVLFNNKNKSKNINMAYYAFWFKE